MTDYRYENKPEYESQETKDLRDDIGRTYNRTRLFTGLAIHALAPFVTGGLSLIVTAAVGYRAIATKIASDISSEPNHFESGEELAGNLAAEKHMHSANPLSASMRAGIKDGVVGTIMQPFAWGALIVAGVIDLVGHGARAVDSGTAALMGANDETIAKKSAATTFGKTNTLRDVFWKVAAISPSKTDAKTIMENSALPVDDTLHEQRKNARGQTFEF